MNFYLSKDNIKNVKEQDTEQRKIPAVHIYKRRLVSRIYKKLLQISNAKLDT